MFFNILYAVDCNYYRNHTLNEYTEVSFQNCETFWIYMVKIKIEIST